MATSKYPENIRQQRAKASRGWKRRNKAHSSSKRKAWGEKNKTHRKEWAKEYYERSKEKIKEYDAMRYMRPENVAKREANKAKKAAYMKAWYKKNRGRAIALVNKRRARKKKSVSGNLQLIKQWEQAWRDKPIVVCYWCLGNCNPEDCHTDHIIAFKHNGLHTIENLCISCAPCNMRKQGKSLKVWNSQISQPVLF